MLKTLVAFLAAFAHPVRTVRIRKARAEHAAALYAWSELYRAGEADGWPLSVHVELDAANERIYRALALRIGLGDPTLYPRT